MPTGLKNSPAILAPGMIRQGPRASINIASQVIFAATNVPQVFPPHFVPPGLVPLLRGVNGQTGNAQSAYVSDCAEGLFGQGFRIITSDTEISYPADNLGRIWVMGTKGDGVLATINGAAID
jgi:hypothetical protein